MGEAYLLCSKENQFPLSLFASSINFFLYFFLSQPLALNITDVPRLPQGTPRGSLYTVTVPGTT